jgi:hypothetical protein
MTKRLSPEVKAANKIKFSKLRSKQYTGETNPFFGKHHTDESKQIIRESKIGKPSPRKGAVLSDETKNKIRIARIGNYCKPRKPHDDTTKIALPNKMFAIIDSEDFDKLSECLWCVSKRGNVSYVHRTLGKGKYETMHHAIMGVPEKGLMIDHINGNGLDNRRCNLRVVTNRENCLNKYWRKK